jgi:siroheme synthase
VTRAGETVVRGTISDIASRVDARALAGPALMIIGRVLGLEAAASSENTQSETMPLRDRVVGGQR